MSHVCGISIIQCRSYLDPENLFKGDVEETLLRVNQAMKGLTAFKDIFESTRIKMKEFFKNGEPREWEFTPVLVFHRYDRFIERINKIRVSSLKS